MAQVCQELAGDGNLDVWEVDRIVGAYRLPNGSCRYAVVWAVEEEGGGSWATAEDLGMQEPCAGSKADDDAIWHRHFGTGIAASQSLLLQWEIEDDQPLPRPNRKRKQPDTKTYAFWATTSGKFSSDVLGNSQFLEYKEQRGKHTKLNAAPKAKPVHVQTHGTDVDEHWFNMWTLEAVRDSTNTTGVSYSRASSGERFTLKSWVLAEFAGYGFISKDKYLNLGIKTR